MTNATSANRSGASQAPVDISAVIDANKLSAAVKYWNRVDVASEYWLDALFEESWAYFLQQDYPRALGNIHTLREESWTRPCTLSRIRHQTRYGPYLLRRP